MKDNLNIINSNKALKKYIQSFKSTETSITSSKTRKNNSQKNLHDLPTHLKQ